LCLALGSRAQRTVAKQGILEFDQVAQNPSMFVDTKQRVSSLPHHDGVSAIFNDPTIIQPQSSFTSQYVNRRLHSPHSSLNSRLLPPYDSPFSSIISDPSLSSRYPGEQQQSCSKCSSEWLPCSRYALLRDSFLVEKPSYADAEYLRHELLMHSNHNISIQQEARARKLRSKVIELLTYPCLCYRSV